ncbi:MAG TPA: phytanoyl-CoA dioxygenase family protein, partial [Longimicrobium sp.]|nr:phytanoyl-CoA dioxygenase family protein [Longimicrobium sp.]
MSDHLYELRTVGFTVLRGALAPERVVALRQTIDRLLAEDDAEWGADTLAAIGQRGALRNLCESGEPFRELLSSFPAFPLLDALLGRDYILHSYDSLVLFPGDGRFPWDFHTDVSPLGGVGFPADRTPSINCLCYVDETTAVNGATWLIPGSHRSVMRDPAPEDLGVLATQAVGQAGDVLVFDARIWHCAGENRSALPRRLIKVMFCKPWLRPQMDYSRAVTPATMALLDDRVRRLLGVGA